MSEAKHTPGPWHTTRDGVSVVKPHPSADTEFARQQGYIIAHCGTQTVGAEPTDECRANARLIAAAPELLAACKRLLQLAGPTIAAQDHTDKEFARAAIAKATGEHV